MINIHKPIKVQVAFQGGGAKLYGLIAAAKAIKKLESNRIIRVTRVAGSSAGAIVAALYSVNVEADEMREYFSSLPSNLKDNQVKMLENISSLKGIKCFLAIVYSAILVLVFKKSPLSDKILKNKLLEIDEIKNKKIKDAEIDLIITKTNILTQEANICDDGDDIIESLVSSCRIPFLIGDNPKEHSYDGGLTVNLPSNYLLEKAHEKGTVIGISFKKDEKKESKSLIRKTFSFLSALIDSSVNINKSNPDVFVAEIKSQNVKFSDFEKMRKILSDNDSIEFNNVYNDIKDKLNNEFLKDRFAINSSLKNRWKNLCVNIPYINNKSEDELKGVIVNYQYANVDGVRSMQDELEKYLKDNIRWGNVLPQGKYFDALQRPEIAITSKAIYLFPFFMSRLRRNYWGVIEYGNHKAVGILINKDSLLSNDRVGDLCKYIDEYHKYTFEQVDEEKCKKNHWIDELVNTINAKNGHIITLSGYLFNELLPLMAIDSGDYKLISDMQITGIPIDANSIKINDGKVKDVYYGYKNSNSQNDIVGDKHYEIYASILSIYESNYHNSVVIYDLAHQSIIDYYINKINEKNGGKILSMSVRHYLDIMVGIGFSLPAYNSLFGEKKEYWSTMQQIAFNNLSNYCLGLHYAGIEFKKNTILN